MWIWQQPAWPDFTWDNTVISPLLREAHFNQGLLLGRMGLENQQQATLDTLLVRIPAIPDTDTVLIRTVFSFCFLCSYFYFNCPVCSSFLIDSPLNSIR